MAEPDYETETSAASAAPDLVTAGQFVAFRPFYAPLPRPLLMMQSPPVEISGSLDEARQEADRTFTSIKDEVIIAARAAPTYPLMYRERGAMVWRDVPASYARLVSDSPST